MPTGELSQIINTDIYLIDQILKGRYNGGGKLLDAGCGRGRNISWFALQPNFDIYAPGGIFPNHFIQFPVNGYRVANFICGIMHAESALPDSAEK